MGVDELVNKALKQLRNKYRHKDIEITINYPCGCVLYSYPTDSYSRGFCLNHWDGGYFVGIKKPEYKLSEGPKRIEDDWVC